MSTLTEGRRAGDFILSELPGTLSRDTVLVDVPPREILAPGRVLGIVSATNHYAPYSDGNSDGTEVAAGVLYAELDNSTGIEVEAMTGVVINFGAEVRKDGLAWGADVDEDGGIADLAAVGIKARD